jgi:hypothetical protein
MFGTSPHALQQMQEAIADLDDIREAIGETRLHPAGYPAWRQAVKDALSACVDHFDRQELGILADFRRRADRPLRSSWPASGRRSSPPGPAT